MLESLGSLTSGPWIAGPWIYLVIAVSIILDVFVPIMPSGVLLITAATAAAAGATNATTNVPDTFAQDVPELLLLAACAATASLLGDFAAYRLAWRGGERLDRAISRSRRLSAAQERLGNALSRGGGILVVVARFAPAGRSVVSLGAGAAHRRAKEFVPWSALAGVTWALYSVTLGYFGGQWLGGSWLSTGISVLALALAGTLAAYVVRRPRTSSPASNAAVAAATSSTA
ncbi:VTT domain-containing protein [Streptomyces sp. NBC_00237]|uniref:DedA family protein n=1 Tax=Streptomyces sp. NBC_00237 TaxID=2975687 RepID=UPI00225589D6|nr:VTT domain-containing protein [Streptomyces sp. NBC_00237]MCX5201454.1 VTT domain-containing protein [Streptomyces sp. NBC_00237]